MVRLFFCTAALGLLLTSSIAHAQSATQLRFEVDGETVSAVDLPTLINRAGCECSVSLEVAFGFSVQGTEGGLKVLSGRGCVDSDMTLDSSCEVLSTRRLETLDAVVSIDTDVSQLLGSSCSDEEGEDTLYVVADVDDQDEWTELATLAFSRDTQAPDAPTGGTVTAGEGLVEVAFSVDEDEIEVGTEYQILCRQGDEAVFVSPPAASFVSSEDQCGASGDVKAAFVCAKASSSLSSVTITGLQDGLPYSFSVVSLDASGNVSAPVALGTATPSPEQDLFERYKEAGGSSDGGHCFVATSAYGNYEHPQVRSLRGFRDHVLMPTWLGRHFVAAYYAVSPPIAAVIAEADVLRATTRVLLKPLVWLADSIEQEPSR